MTVHSGPGRITVTDDCPGLPPEHRQRAFEWFWHSPDALALPGSGLGLAIVADMITAHAGMGALHRPAHRTRNLRGHRTPTRS